MNSWASRRKNIYLSLIVLFLTSFSFFIFWKFWYTTPSCFDGIKNGGETGVDCGGSCNLVCRQGELKPVVRWDPRLFEVLPGTWSTLVYVENLNTNADGIAPYKFTIYDEANTVIKELEGTTLLPKARTVGIFEGGIIFENSARPKRATFEFEQNITWKRNNEKNPDVEISHSSLLNLDKSPRVEASIKNNEIIDLENIELVAAIFDGSDNAIATSRTFVERVKKDEKVDIFFTWPRPFDLGTKICEKPSDIMLLLDRSGSMNSLSTNPPRPLLDAKEAAISFVNELGEKDKVGLVSFATEASNPIDLALTSDFESAKKAVEAVSILKSGTQYTNIYEPLHFSWQELISSRASDEASKVIVLLTDGVANSPKSPLSKNEKDDIVYAEDLAIKESLNLKQSGISIFTIGLGSTTNESFLKQTASSEENYFFAPSALNLKSVYKNISSRICKEIPARIEITYKIFGKAI